MIELFTQHPYNVGETYFQHAKFAIHCGIKLLVLGVLAIIHGLFPFLFETTISNEVQKLTKSFEERNNSN